MFGDDELKQLQEAMDEIVKPLKTTVTQTKSTFEAVAAKGQALADKADLDNLVEKLKL